jgi:hypothetical protein
MIMLFSPLVRLQYLYIPVFRARLFFEAAQRVPVPAAALAREGRIEAIFPCAKACMLRASFLFPILLNISVSE